MGKSCCFTGHREISKLDEARLSLILPEYLRDLVKEGYTDFYTGGALGFDTLAAVKIISLRNTMPDVSLHLLLPCRTQAERWTENNRLKYESVKAAADSVTYISEDYSRGCMMARNRALVDNSDLCIAFLNNSKKGGTLSTVKYALKRGIQVVNLGSAPILSQQKFEL